MSRPLSLRRTAILLALVALLLAATLVGAMLGGLFRSPAVAVVNRGAGPCLDGPPRQCPTTISVVYADGHEQTIFPPQGGGPAQVWPPAWSPNGEHLLMEANSLTDEDPFGFELYVVRSDGSDLRRLRSAEQGWCGFLAWSPDGSTIACISEEITDDIQRTSLHAFDVASGASTELAVAEWDFGVGTGVGTIFQRAGDSAYRWSPNGEWLGYVTHEGAADGSSSTALWVVRRDGSDRRQLASGPWLSAEALIDFRWSPASDAIAYGGSLPFPPDAINVVRLDGTRLTITLPDGEGIRRARMVAWDQPDRLTYRSTDWRFVATTALDGTRGEVLFDFRGLPPWGEAVPWGGLWLVADGQSLAWWEERNSQTCLMAADNDRRVQARFCIDDALGLRAVGQE